MKYFYIFILSILTGQIYSMDFVSIKGIVENIQISINNNDHKLATKWLNRLELIVAADWSLLDINQVEKYQEFYFDILDKVSAIEPKNLKKETTFERLHKEMELKETEANWLVKIIENDQCEDAKWIEFLGAITKPLPSPKTLKKKRINELNKTGSLQPMEK